MKRKPTPLQWSGDVNFPKSRIEGERTHDGEHQRVRLFVEIADGHEVEVPLPVIPEWVHDALDEQFEREPA